MRAALSTLLAFALAAPAVASEIQPADLDRLPPADVVFLGEVHDNPAHHAHQARAVAAIRPAALVFEMILPDQPARLPADRGDAAAMARALDWDARGWPDFAMYHPIFTAAPDARIYGADVAQADLARAMGQGAAAVLPDPSLGLAAPLPDAVQAGMEDLLWAAHCYAMPRAAMAPMVQAQRLRDAALADAARRALAETGGPVVVITGTGHARTDHGAPAILTRAAPDATVLSVGQMEAAPDTAPPHDLWLVTEGVAGRGNPCAAFGGTEG
ncbi:MAG: hypothetical protein RIR62_2786 [Pseudomonadota bacterium]